MKLFVYEHITSGALIDEPLPPSLAREGNDMLQAIIDDFLQLHSIELIILRDARLPELNNHDKISCQRINNQGDFQQLYRNAVEAADFILPIAPETDQLLTTIQEEALTKGKILLGCQPETTRLCSDKYRCYQILRDANIETIPTLLASNWLENPFSSPAYIIKPRDGAGCIDTLFFADKKSVSDWLTEHPANLSHSLIQPYTQGKAISLSILYSETDSIILSINEQHILHDNGLIHFKGCTVNGVTEAQFSFSQAHRIADSLRQEIRGLWGFVGIDLILDDDNKGEATIVDINPRLTTSYIGLHQSLETNPAQLLLKVIDIDSSTVSSSFRRNAIKVSV